MPRTALNPDTVFDSLQYGFSQGLIVTGQRRIMLSGQVGVDAQERTVGPGLNEQTDAALDNIERVLAAAGAAMRHIIMLRIYICEDARAAIRKSSPTRCAAAFRTTRRPPPGSSSAACRYPND